MNLTVRIPDDLAERLGADATALERRALEALVADEYRAGRLDKPDLRRFLGFETGYEIDDFLKAHGVYHNYTGRSGTGAEEPGGHKRGQAHDGRRAG